MKFTIQAVFKRSVTIECDNQTICYAPEEYSVLLDGEERARSTLNVLTIDGLQPDSDYTLSLRTEDGEETQSFHTEAESVLLDVRSFGAHGDGETDDTIYLQAAISACPKDGTVYVPAGTYLSRPLFLKSYMSLWLDEGAVLKGDPDGHSDYVQNQSFHPVDDKTPTIGTIRAENITCTGADACMLVAYGLPERYIENIVLKNIKVDFLPKSERKPRQTIMMDHFPEMSGRAIYARNVKRLTLENVEITDSDDTEPVLQDVLDYDSVHVSIN